MDIAKALRVNLEQDLVDELDKIKSYLGLKLDSDCVRFLIRDKYREIDEKGGFKK